MIESTSWYTFKCRMPKAVLDLLETELERIRLLANIDPDDELSQEVKDGLAMEYLVALSSQTSDEEVM